MINIPIVTIDGPSGSGKGTLSVSLSKYLNWKLLDSGALYRVLAFGIENNNLWNEDIENWVKLAHKLPVSFRVENEKSIAYYEGQPVEHIIRTEAFGEKASLIASEPRIREALLSRQRDFQKAPGLVADGRDMGSVVFPDAFLKIFLTANAESRAQRRYLQLKEKDESVTLASVLSEIKQRDDRDIQRSSSPLVPAEDAVLIDSTGMSISEVLNHVLSLVTRRQNITE
jgi:CMP/dCMP kinase